MKSLPALGWLLLLSGVVVLVAVAPLRPVGGALAICGAALVVFGWTRPRARSGPEIPPPPGPDEGARVSPPLYQAQPRELPVSGPPPASEAAFTTPNPGSVPGAKGAPVPMPEPEQHADGELPPMAPRPPG